MGITVGRYAFEGPYTSTDNIQDKAGVYAIHCYRNGKYYLVDVGESGTVKSRIENHGRKSCWQRNCSGTLTFSVYYTPNLHQQGRMKIEKEIRDQYNPPCGEV
ncbi:MAG: hypothetical protein DRP54_06545 [Spirochaetes bacterium]|nr:MAG: hypothetical protein DRP54_06545 [Spirochaetota bacterium]